MGFYQFHPIPSKVRSLQLAPGQLSARSPWLKPGDGNWPGSVANTCNDLLKLFLAGTALMLSHMKRRETSHQFVLSLFSAIVAYSCHSIRISQACGKLSWKLAPICSGRQLSKHEPKLARSNPLMKTLCTWDQIQSPMYHLSYLVRSHVPLFNILCACDMHIAAAAQCRIVSLTFQDPGWSSMMKDDWSQTQVMPMMCSLWSSCVVPEVNHV